VHCGDKRNINTYRIYHRYHQLWVYVHFPDELASCVTSYAGIAHNAETHTLYLFFFEITSLHARLVSKSLAVSEMQKRRYLGIADDNDAESCSSQCNIQSTRVVEKPNSLVLV